MNSNTQTRQQQFAALLRDESGQDLIEYALVAALVGLGAVAGIKTLSTSIKTAFTSIGTTLTTNV
jgi:pilus assembly protein Flp/PilA